jgi:hypothetical protein
MPLAQTCTACFVRKDRSAVWCEVTASLRSRDAIEEERPDDGTCDGSRSQTTNDASSFVEEDDEELIVLSLRPTSKRIPPISTSIVITESGVTGALEKLDEKDPRRPPKKRVRKN